MTTLETNSPQCRRIGLIGGIGWPSTGDYYARMNRMAASRAGPLAGADLVIRSLNFAEVLAAAERPGGVEQAFLQAAQELRAAGAEVLGVCSNTGHLFCEPLRALPGLAFVAMEQVLAKALEAAGVRRAFLLGTKRALAHPLFPQTLAAHGIQTELPSPAVQDQLDEAIFAELERGVVGPGIAAALAAVESELVARGAENVVLACTELPPAVAQHPLPFRLWDTVELHAAALMRMAWIQRDTHDAPGRNDGETLIKGMRGA